MVDLRLKPDDRPSDEDGDDTAIAVDLETLGQIEADVLMLNGFLGEARQAVREALGLIESPKARRALHRAQRAQNDALKRGTAVVERARGL